LNEKSHKIKNENVRKCISNYQCLTAYCESNIEPLEAIFPVPDPNDDIHLFIDKEWYQQLSDDSEEKCNADEDSRTICEFLS